MFERSWSAVAPVAVTATGTDRGIITVSSTRGFFVKQTVTVTNPSSPDQSFQINRVLSSSQMILGAVGSKIDAYSDLTLIDSTYSAYARAQARPAIPLQELQRAVYAEEPTVAIRTIGVDELGNPYSTKNPIPVQLSDSSINIETLNAELVVHLTDKDNVPKAGDVHSSVRLGDGTNQLAINPDGSLNFNLVQSGAPGLSIRYNEITAVASGAESPIITMVVPPEGFRLMKVEVSGENVALFALKIDGVTIFTKRSWWNGFNQTFSFEDFQNGLKLTNGQILTITVIHNRPVPANFEATVMGI